MVMGKHFFFLPFWLGHMEILGVREQANLQAIAKAQPSFFHLSS